MVDWLACRLYLGVVSWFGPQLFVVIMFKSKFKTATGLFHHLMFYFKMYYMEIDKG